MSLGQNIQIANPSILYQGFCPSSKIRPEKRCTFVDQHFVNPSILCQGFCLSQKVRQTKKNAFLQMSNFLGTEYSYCESKYSALRILPIFKNTSKKMYFCRLAVSLGQNSRIVNPTILCQGFGSSPKIHQKNIFVDETFP